MLRIGKLSQQAIAAATVLAERYGGDAVRLSASEIADARELPRPVVAKVLATLAQSGIVSGAPGPSGGYRLARPPETVALYDIVAAFERTDVRPMCPFGPNWCGTGDLCPLHDAIEEASEQVIAFLKRHHLGVFRKAGEKN
ncbi:MAG: Rrf2 family transcriptional regulator [Akkermansiaceae bacterium]|nr:Rrf2 family transcriptional regulator [Akkermansiaceae bacterium]